MIQTRIANGDSISNTHRHAEDRIRNFYSSRHYDETLSNISNSHFERGSSNLWFQLHSRTCHLEGSCLLGLAILLFLTGSARFSVDRLISRKRRIGDQRV
jgi:hypothetical protein